MPMADQQILLEIPEQAERKAKPQHGELKLKSVNRQQTLMANITAVRLKSFRSRELSMNH